MKIQLLTCFLLLCSFSAYVQNNELWVRNMQTQKELLIPPKNFETYFKLPLEKLPNLMPEESVMFYSDKFKLEDGYIGGNLSFESIKEDSLSLIFKSFFSITPEENKTYHYKINFHDIKEIQLQRTHSKLLEDIWVYGGIIGAAGLIVSPLMYFFENKAAGISIFSVGVAATTMSFISYKLYFGYDKYDKRKFEFFVR